MCVIDVGGPADPIAPSIIVPPKNTSVTMGRNEAVIECVANARYVFTQTDTQAGFMQTPSLTSTSDTLWLELILRSFVWTWWKSILFVSHFVPLPSALRSLIQGPSRSVHAVLRNSSPESWLLSPIQRLNQNDRCIPLLSQCSITLKQNMNLY